MTDIELRVGRREVVLASGSESRQRLLRNAGIEPRVISSGVDEFAVSERFIRSRTHSTIPETAHALAKAKALAVARNAELPETALVIGCDSILEWGGVALGKPRTEQAAKRRLGEMRGTRGTLHTGHHVVNMSNGVSIGRTASTTVRFGQFSDAEIDAYVKTGEPLNVAGSFTLDGLSSPFVEAVIGDATNVIGLSLPMFRQLLAELGISWLDVVDWA